MFSTYLGLSPIYSFLSYKLSINDLIWIISSKKMKKKVL